VVEFPPDRGAIVERKTFETLTPLIIAAGLGHFEVGQNLLDHGAKAGRKNHLGLTALTAAIRGGHKKVVKILL
jgi:ankyrin repeat protein